MNNFLQKNVHTYAGTPTSQKWTSERNTSSKKRPNVILQQRQHSMNSRDCRIFRKTYRMNYNFNFSPINLNGSNQLDYTSIIQMKKIWICGNIDRFEVVLVPSLLCDRRIWKIGVAQHTNWSGRKYPLSTHNWYLLSAFVHFPRHVTSKRCPFWQRLWPLFPISIAKAMIEFFSRFFRTNAELELLRRLSAASFC